MEWCVGNTELACWQYGTGMLTIQEWRVYNKAVENHFTTLGVGNTGMVCWQYRNGVLAIQE